MASRLDWRGDEMKAKVRRASQLAIDETTARMVVHAKQNHEWKNRTGTLEGSIQMRPATIIGRTIVGLFGSFSVAYAIFLELGTRFIAAMPYLRPAFDAEAPNLADRIRAHLRAV